MRSRSVRSAVAVVLLAFVVAFLQAAPASSQDFNAMLRRFLEFYFQNKQAEAMAEAQKFEKAIRPTFGTNHTNYGIALNHLGMAHSLAGKYTEAQDYYQRAQAIWEKTDGKTSDNVGRVLNNLAGLRTLQGRNKEVANLAQRAVAIFEKNHGPNDPLVALPLSYWGTSLVALGEYAQAEPILRRTVGIQEKARPPNLPALSAAFENLAGLYWKQGKYKEAEENYKQTIAVRKKAFGDDHPYTAEGIHNLGLVYESQGRFEHAASLYRQAADNHEKHKHASLGLALVSLGRVELQFGRYAKADAFYAEAETKLTKFYGPGSPFLALVYSNRAVVRTKQGRYAEAEDYARRSLALYEKSNGSNSPEVALELNNIAVLFWQQGKREEMNSYARRALDIQEKLLGPKNLAVASTLTNIGNMLFDDGEYDKADAIYLRVLEIIEGNLGGDDPRVGLAAQNLGGNNIKRGRFAEAEVYLKRALSIYQKAYGDAHPVLAEMHTKLAETYRVAGRLDDARTAALSALAMPRSLSETAADKDSTALHELAIIEDLAGHTDLALDYARKASAKLLANPTGDTKSASDAESAFTAPRKSILLRLQLGILASAAVKNTAAAGDLAQEAFETAQSARQSSAGSAVQQMALRFALGGGKLGELVRESQDLITFLKERDKTLIEAMSGSKGKHSDELIDTVRKQTSEAEGRLSKLTALISKEFPDYAELTSTKALSAEELRKLLGPDEAMLFWFTGDALAERLDRSEKKQSYIFAVTREAMQWKTVPLGAQALADKVAKFRRGLDVDLFLQSNRAGSPELFDVEFAHELYGLLVAPVDDLIRGKANLFVVPTGALTALPVHLLVTDKPARAISGMGDIASYRDMAWLLKRQAVTVLPSVGSLKALRVFAQKGKGSKPMIGFGDPVFGPEPGGGAEKRTVAAKTRSFADFWQGASVDRDTLASALPRLADTADELNAIAKSVGAAPGDIYLRQAASETNVKRLSLSEYRTVYFATHGLVAGDVKGLAEASLALTLPKAATELDDGLLTASEVAQLKLNADWVVLSACNTIAGDRPGAEALSGLARAFFYAGARALLVSHWAVESAAATRLTTSTFDIIKSDPKVGSAEALRRAMLSYMSDTGSPMNAHPAFWGPFALIGEGAHR